MIRIVMLESKALYRSGMLLAATILLNSLNDTLLKIFLLMIQNFQKHSKPGSKIRKLIILDRAIIV